MDKTIDRMMGVFTVGLIVSVTYVGIAALMVLNSIGGQ